MFEQSAKMVNGCCTPMPRKGVQTTALCDPKTLGAQVEEPEVAKQLAGAQEDLGPPLASPSQEESRGGGIFRRTVGEMMTLPTNL